MTKAFLLILAAAIVVSCNSGQTGKDARIDTMAIVVNPDSSGGKEDSHYFWSSDLDQHGKLVMKKGVPISIDSLTAINMIQRMNSLYPEVQLSFVRVLGDSIFVKIHKATVLTQQMGSSGAETYLAAVTYNLTEVPGINFVDIRFIEGDHASPGTYTRTDFIHEKE